MKFNALACVFPGQGSQSLGMLAELARDYSLVGFLFDEVSTSVGYDVWRLIQEGPLDVLNQTAQTQVAMLAADVAVFRILELHVSLSSVTLAGHSLGEYAALVCARVLSLTEAAQLVQMRGQLMQETVPLGIGAMAAIVGLSDEAVDTLCIESSTLTEVVSPANYNAIGQVVIAGHTSAVDKAVALADARGARLAKRLPVSVPCHCALLKPTAVQFADVLKHIDFQLPVQTVISTVDLRRYDAIEQTRTRLATQLYSPVRWVETIQWMKSRGILSVIECGPGKVLSGLIKRIDKTLPVISVNDQVSVAQCLRDLREMEAVGCLK